MQKIDVMQMVVHEIAKQNKTASDISRNMHKPYATVIGSLSRSTLQVERLVEFSEALKYNFFRQIADMLPYENPVVKTHNSLYEEEILGLKEKLKVLEIENTILKDTIKTLAGAR